MAFKINAKSHKTTFEKDLFKRASLTKSVAFKAAFMKKDHSSLNDGKGR